MQAIDIATNTTAACVTFAGRRGIPIPLALVVPQ